MRSFRARASAVWRKSSDLLSVKDTPGFRHAYYVAGIFALGCEGIISGYRARVNFNAVAKPQFLPVGEWLSLVEHLVRDQGVGGSNPLSPTKKVDRIRPMAIAPGLPVTP